jgi:hypothetical protein
MVLVVGLMAVWAFAVKVANAIKTARQNKTAVEFPFKADLLRANDARIAEGLTFWPSFPGTLAPGIFTGIQEGIIQTTNAAPVCIRKVLLISKTRERSTGRANIFSDLQACFLTQKKRANELTR